MTSLDCSPIYNRINFVSVIAGIVLTLASMSFWMSLAAALDFWSYRLDELPFLGQSFWILASTAWVVSVFIGSLLTTLASRSTEMKNGILNSITAWAGSYLLFGGIALIIADSNLRNFSGAETVGIFWYGFIGDALSLLSGIAGGVVGTYLERHKI